MKVIILSHEPFGQTHSFEVSILPACTSLGINRDTEKFREYNFEPQNFRLHTDEVIRVIASEVLWFFSYILADNAYFAAE